jgi:hypothetical protein
VTELLPTIPEALDERRLVVRSRTGGFKLGKRWLGAKDFRKARKMKQIARSGPGRLQRRRLFAKFRRTPKYQRLVRVMAQFRKRMMASEEPRRASLLERFRKIAALRRSESDDRAEAAVELYASGHDVENLFALLNGRDLTEDAPASDRLLLALVEAGIVHELLEVEQDAEGNLYVYLDENVAPRLKEILTLLSRFGDAQIVKRPDEDPSAGLYAVRVAAQRREPHETLALGDDTVCERCQSHDVVLEDACGGTLLCRGCGAFHLLSEREAAWVYLPWVAEDAVVVAPPALPALDVKAEAAEWTYLARRTDGLVYRARGRFRSPHDNYEWHPTAWDYVPDRELPDDAKGLKPGEIVLLDANFKITEREHRCDVCGRPAQWRAAEHAGWAYRCDRHKREVDPEDVPPEDWIRLTAKEEALQEDLGWRRVNYSARQKKVEGWTYLGEVYSGGGSLTKGSTYHGDLWRRASADGAYEYRVWKVEDGRVHEESRPLQSAEITHGSKLAVSAGRSVQQYVLKAGVAEGGEARVLPALAPVENATQDFKRGKSDEKPKDYSRDALGTDSHGIDTEDDDDKDEAGRRFGTFKTLVPGLTIAAKPAAYFHSDPRRGSWDLTIRHEGSGLPLVETPTLPPSMPPESVLPVVQQELSKVDWTGGGELGSSAPHEQAVERLKRRLNTIFRDRRGPEEAIQPGVVTPKTPLNGDYELFRLNDGRIVLAKNGHPLTLVNRAGVQVQIDKFARANPHVSVEPYQPRLGPVFYVALTAEALQSLFEALTEDYGDEILRQLGGNRFIAMTGAKNFVYGGRTLSFQIGRNPKGINLVHVTLEPSDLFTVEFFRVRGGGARTGYRTSRTRVAAAEHVDSENLAAAFERETGLRTSLGSGGPRPRESAEKFVDGTLRRILGVGLHSKPAVKK